MTTKLYLDLEETVITNWNDALLMNVSRVRDFLDDNPDIDRDDVRVFSFAIYDGRDKATFEREMKPMLERALGVTITAWPSVLEMAEASQRYTGVRWLDADTMGGLDICEFISIKGKPGAFEDWVFSQHTAGDRVALIDDIVPHRTILDHGRDIQLDFLNVARIGRVV